MVRAKLKLSAIVSTDYSNSYQSKVVKFDAIYDPSIPEDARFAKASPSGHFEMQVDNPAALEQLKVGQYYYFDVTPVPAEVK